jgi:hypothetical protein
MVDLARKLNLNMGKKVQIYKGIVRMGKSGEREIYLNELSNIQLFDQDTSEDDLPDVFINLKTVTSIEKMDKDKEIDVKAIISSKNDVKTFKKEDREGT